jgi:NADH dehydrogenase
MKKVLIFGGTGFLGGYVVRELCAQNFQVIVVAREEENFAVLKTYGFPGQILFRKYDVASGNFNNDFDFSGYYAVINLIGIGEEKKGNGYYKIHVDFPFKLAILCKKYGVKLVHISAFFSDDAAIKDINLKYVKTKLEGEASVKKQYSKAIIIRPTLMLGIGDSFISTFETIINLSFIIPLPSQKASKKMKPVFVGDVAKFIVFSLENDEYLGQSFNLCGPGFTTVSKIVHLIASAMNKKRLFVSVPFFVFKLLILLKTLMPKFIFHTKITKDIMELSRFEMVPKKNSLNLALKPMEVTNIINNTLSKYKLYD